MGEADMFLSAFEGVEHSICSPATASLAFDGGGVSQRVERRRGLQPTAAGVACAGAGAGGCRKDTDTDTEQGTSCALVVVGVERSGHNSEQGQKGR